MSDVFAGVVGQPRVVEQLRAAAGSPVHAYLLVGDAGAGLRAAKAFSAALLCDQGGCGACRTCRLALAGEHPDALTWVPEGAFLRVREDAEPIINLALRSPVEGARKVLVLTEMHRVQRVGPMLLKTIEEPPESTVFVVLADHVPDELVTIASRCVRIDLPPLTEGVIADALAAEGVDPEAATRAAAASVGSLDRARTLAADAGLAARRDLWASVPRRLDGTGAAVAVLVEELLAAVEESMAALVAVQAGEIEELEAQAERYGGRGSGRSALIAAHKRQQRRHRTAELRFGLATLAACYREALASGASRAVVEGLDALDRAAQALARNPNEALLLQALLVDLPPLPAPGRSTAAR